MRIQNKRIQELPQTQKGTVKTFKGTPMRWENHIRNEVQENPPERNNQMSIP